MSLVTGQCPKLDLDCFILHIFLLECKAQVCVCVCVCVCERESTCLCVLVHADGECPFVLESKGSL